MSATFLRTRIITALRLSGKLDAAKNVSQNFIFDHPTIQQLAHAIHALVFPEANSKPAHDSLQQTRDMIAKYTAGMAKVRSTQRQVGGGSIVLLTGSTGNLGTHILTTLLEDDRVSRVFTLDRASSDVPITRLEAAFTDRGLPANILSSSKLISLTGTLNLPNFGLHQDVYDEVSRYYRLPSTICDPFHAAGRIDHRRSS